MHEAAERVEGVNMEIMHDVKNLVGVVHAAAVDLERAHASGDELTELIEELVSLTTLVSESLRGLVGEGRHARPFDLRAAAFCARVWQRNIAVGALMRQTPVDAEAGDVTEFVIALAVALGASTDAVSIQEDQRVGLRFVPATQLESVAREALAALSGRAEALSMTLELEGGSVRLSAKP